jgi:pyruvate dehydrogenase E1 component alpha subunit
MPQKEIASFSVSNLSVLDAEGKVDKALEPDLKPQQLRDIYRAMWLGREFDQKMLNLQRQGRIGTFGPSTGQEACVVGAAFAMEEQDWFVGSFRELAGRLARGEPLSSMLFYLNGYEEGNVLPESHAKRVLPTSVIVGSQGLHGVGISYAMNYLKESAASVVFFGDGATSEGDMHEAFNFAAVWQTPTVFFCQNNQWAISIPRKKQMHCETIAQKAIAYGMPGIQVDGNDALAVYRATKEALDRARAGGGPTMIEAITFRLMMHTTADDPKRYRTEEETAKWWKIEPLIRFRKYLEKRKLWDDKKQAAMEESVKQEIEAAVEEFEAVTEFKSDAPFDHVFGTDHDVIEEQRQQFLSDLEQENADA